MSGTHWTEKEFINHLYGVGPDTAHLEICRECRDRVAALSAARRQVIREPEVSAEFLAHQRRAVYRRLGSEPRRSVRMFPAFAVALVVLLALLVMRPGSQTPAPLVTSADSQLFSDIYELEQSSEPQAVRTIQALFEEN